jgi:hypothetical protein
MDILLAPLWKELRRGFALDLHLSTLKVSP